LRGVTARDTLMRVNFADAILMNTKQQLRIETVLLNLGLDRNQIARELDVDRSTVSLTLSGKRAAEATLDAISEVVRNRFKELVTSEQPESTTA